MGNRQIGIWWAVLAAGLWLLVGSGSSGAYLALTPSNGTGPLAGRLALVEPAAGWPVFHNFA